jgi:hypothetical protein
MQEVCRISDFFSCVTAIRELLRIIALMYEIYPNSVSQSSASGFQKILVSMLGTQLNSSKVQTIVLEAVLVAFNVFLRQFSSLICSPKSLHDKRLIYNVCFVALTSFNNEKSRALLLGWSMFSLNLILELAALDLVRNHYNCFADLIYSDCLKWFDNLLSIFNMNDRRTRDVTMNSLESIIRAVSDNVLNSPDSQDAALILKVHYSFPH